MNIHKLHKIVGLIVALSMCMSIPAGIAMGQETGADADDDIIHLDPFTVTASEGYTASNSIGGTRTDTPIREIPLNIQVFTKDLADDMVLTSQVDFERYNASMINGGDDVHSNNVVQQAYNGFLLRGFTQNWGTRDGTRQYDPIDMAGLSRVEVVKGPAAAMYGLTYPGGVMNSITKSVDFNRNFANATFSIDSEGEYRATIDANFTDDVEVGQFGIRYNGAYAQTRDHRAHSDGRTDYQQAIVTWMPAPTTKIEFMAEEGFKGHPNGLGYFSTGETDDAGDALGNGADIPLQIIHPEIPWDWNWGTQSNVRTLESNYYRGKITHSFNENLSVMAYWGYQQRINFDSEGLDASGGGGSGASWDMGWSSQGGNATGWLNPGAGDDTEVIRMHWHHRDWQNKGHIYGAIGVYKLELGNVMNTFTFGGNDWSEQFITFKGTQPGIIDDDPLSEESPNLYDFPISTSADPTNVPIGPPNDYFMDVAGAYQQEDNSNSNVFAAWQMSAVEGRLRTNLAINRSKISMKQYDNGLSTAPDNITKDAANSPLLGVMFDVTDTVSLFALHGTSLFPTTDKNDFEVQMPPVEGESFEFGTKFDILEGKINGTLSYYQITQTGGSQRDESAINRNKVLWDSYTDQQRLDNFPGLTRDELEDRGGNRGDLVPGGEQESKGYELDVIIKPTSNLQLLLSYAHNKVKTTKAINTDLIGQSPNGSIKNQLSFLTKYSFSEGGLEGLSVGLGGQLAGKALQGYHSDGVTARYTPSTKYLEAFAIYNTEVLGKRSFIQLNIRNLTKQDEFVGWKATGSSDIWATERYGVPTKMRLNLTVGVEF